MSVAWTRWAACILGLVACAPGKVTGWEVCLRPTVATQSALVRLQDVADITGQDVPADAALHEIVVALGPTTGRNRELTPADVRRKLDQQGVDLRACQFTGAPRVVIAYGHPVPIPDAEPSTITPQRARSLPQPRTTPPLQRRLQEAVAQQLQQLAGDDCPWIVKVTYVERVPSLSAAGSEEIRLESLPPATEGTHQLVAFLSNAAEQVRLPFEAQIRRSIPVVVPVRALVRGEVVRSEDVELRYVDKAPGAGTSVERLEDAVGRQVREGVGAGQPLTAGALQQPLLVRKRDRVQVLVRCGGIRAHRSAIALNEGARGDMITVQTTDESKTEFNARVVNIRQVEVLSDSTSQAQ